LKYFLVEPAQALCWLQVELLVMSLKPCYYFCAECICDMIDDILFSFGLCLAFSGAVSDRCQHACCSPQHQGGRRGMHSRTIL